MALSRARAILKARKYIRADISSYRWVREMRELGLGYHYQTMLADYRSVLHREEKKDTLQYVRKDYYPSEKHYATVSWEFEKEFMYVIRAKVRVAPGDPITERKVNIQTDTPMTPTEMMSEVERRWGEREEDYPEELITVVPFLAMRRE